MFLLISLHYVCCYVSCFVSIEKRNEGINEVIWSNYEQMNETEGKKPDKDRQRKLEGWIELSWAKRFSKYIDVDNNTENENK